VEDDWEAIRRPWVTTLAVMSVFSRRRRAIADRLDASPDARPRRTRLLDIDKITTAPAAMKALHRALDRQNERVRDIGGEMLEVQLLGQATAAAEWPKLLAYWQQRHPAGTAEWPRRVDPGAWVMNLWPLPAGSANHARGVGGDVGMRQPTKMYGAPALTVFNPQRRGTAAATALALVCALWLEGLHNTDYPAMRFAPPILEAWAPGGRLLFREVIDYGLAWSLPPAAGV
jgi:hypothetical protein